MQTLTATLLNTTISNIQHIADQMDLLQKHKLNFTPWIDYPYKPDVELSLAHDNKNLCLKFYVTEEKTLAVYKEINAPVYEDSCVEFFIMFDETGYYNLEFNSLGAILIGFGQDKHNRILLTESVITKIKTYINSEKLSNTGKSYWELTAVIPDELFIKHNINTFNNIKAKGNFYKCGDKMEQPHFVTWSAIQHEKPNFHLPIFFGDLLFE